MATAVVPTLGGPYLAATLEALRADGGDRLQVVVVAQGRGVGGGQARHPATGLADLWLELPDNRGFTGGTNAGIEAARRPGSGLAPTPYVATVNDDALVRPGWLAVLVAALEADPRAAAAQGVNLAGLAPGGGGKVNGGETGAPGAGEPTPGEGDGGAVGGETEARAAADTPPGGGKAGDGTMRRLDGWGLGWNRWWQAVQLGHGEPETAAPTETRHVFGVSATAALYRWAALESLGGTGPPASATASAAEKTGGGPARGRDDATPRPPRREGTAPAGPFDPGLVSWYEDADLAVRLRRAGWHALAVPAARADHAGAAPGRRRRPAAYGALLHGNRWLVVARLRGRRFPLAVPRLLARDLLDLARRPRLAPAIARGWLRAMRHLPGFLSPAPAVSPDAGDEAPPSAAIGPR